jgi:hypothetical protein
MIPAERAEKTPMSSGPMSGMRMFGARKYRPKNPSTMVGMPAIVSSTGLTTFRTRVLAYSARATAVSRPSGMAMTMAITATSTVPLMRARTPNAYGLIDADQTVPVKNSTGLTCWKNSSVSKARTSTMPIVVAMPRTADRSSRDSMTRSVHGRCRVRGRGVTAIRSVPRRRVVVSG